MTCYILIQYALIGLMGPVYAVDPNGPLVHEQLHVLPTDMKGFQRVLCPNNKGVSESFIDTVHRVRHN